MKNLSVVVLVALLAAAAYAAKPISLLPVEETTIYNYHRRFGIPEAKRILLEEEQLAQNPSRIVGGWGTERGEHPYMAGLLIMLDYGETSMCGASLLTNNHLVTAGHCYWDGHYHATNVMVVLGSNYLYSGGTRISAYMVQQHENFNPPSPNHDIAIIYTYYIPYTNFIQSIALPTVNTSPSYVGYIATASGYGRRNDAVATDPYPEARHVLLEVITNSECQQTYGANIFPSSMCTSGSGGGICGGDSGGPLAYDNSFEKILIGVLSWFSPFGCDVGHPSVHVRVTYYMSWIRQRIEEFTPEYGRTLG